MTHRPNGLTYAEAGVDIDAGNALVERIKPAAAATARPGVLAGLGGFGALFDLKAAGYRDPVLVAATDGVGTKLRLAIETGQLGTVGIDLVAMCVNDLVCQGAEPLFFLDYFATGRLEVDSAAAVIEGIAAGCAEAGAALVGGETAEMPGMYAGGDFDLAGFAVGAMERGAALPQGVAAGDVLLGLASSGVHSNGYSLVRRIVAATGLALEAPCPFGAGTLGAALLAPTRVYVRPALAALRAGGLRGLAHITGGGLTENLPRILPEGAGAEIDLDAWALPAVFGWLREEGGIADPEMLKTFNCGIGMVAVVAPERAEALADVLGGGGRGGDGDRPRGSRRGRALFGASVSRRRVAILISGGGSNMLALAGDMAKPDHPAEVCLVLANRPEAGGLARAAALGLPVAAVDHRPFRGDRAGFEAALAGPLGESGAEILCLAGFMRVLTPGFIAAWEGRMLNIHPSILPLFPGLDTHARALAAGMAVHGCTVHEVTPELELRADPRPGRHPGRAGRHPGRPSPLASCRMEHRLYPAVLRRFAAGDRRPRWRCCGVMRQAIRFPGRSRNSTHLSAIAESIGDMLRVRSA